MAEYQKGDAVVWDWGNGVARGKISKVYTRKITRSIKGTDVTRKATKDEPALLIVQDDGDEVLKSSSEVRKG